MIVGSWSAVVLWMFLIFLASGQDFLLVSGREVDFRFSLFPSWTSEWIYHGAAFGGLAALTYAALRVSLPWNWQVVALLSLTIRRGLRPHRRVAPKLRGQQTRRYTRCRKGRHRRDCCYSARERYFLWRRATAPQAVGDGLAGSWRYGCDGRGANRHVASSTVDASWITGVILTGFVARERVPIGCSRGIVKEPLAVAAALPFTDEQQELPSMPHAVGPAAYSNRCRAFSLAESRRTV